MAPEWRLSWHTVTDALWLIHILFHSVWRNTLVSELFFCFVIFWMMTNKQVELPSSSAVWSAVNNGLLVREMLANSLFQWESRADFCQWWWCKNIKASTAEMFNGDHLAAGQHPAGEPWILWVSWVTFIIIITSFNCRAHVCPNISAW